MPSLTDNLKIYIRFCASNSTLLCKCHIGILAGIAESVPWKVAWSWNYNPSIPCLCAVPRTGASAVKISPSSRLSKVLDPVYFLNYNSKHVEEP